MKIIFENDLPFIPLGAGSNILFSDDGFRGVAISLGQMKQIDIIEDNKTEIKLKTSAGASLAGTIRRFAKFSALGVSRMWGIPGQIGGSIACNAGAFDFNLSDLICEIELLDKKCKKIVSKIRDLDYGYRNMQLPPGAIVTSAILRAHKGDPLEIERELDIAKQKRRHSQPRGVASAGCIFRNPSPENPAGAIIDRLGFKGMRIGSAEVSNKHANFIVNHGKARACDVLELIDRIRHRALDEEGINLELEIRLAGHGV
jgi:UDP-N-acetylmuramate dehydrogenase